MKHPSLRPSTSRIPIVLLFGCSALALGLSTSRQIETLSNPVLDRATEPQPTAPATESAVPEGLDAEDWAGIREAYEAGRHAAYPVEGGYQARNPGQQWRTHFDGRGFTIVSDAGDWTWGLELERYGFRGSERQVTSPERVKADGGGVAYEWDAILDEWYVNHRRGLEHGYTVHRRPSGVSEAGVLTLTLAVRGSLQPDVDTDGRGVRFRSEDGSIALTYTGLSVVDAAGRELEASLDSGGDRLSLSIDERGATYPLTIDPIAQQAYLKSSNTDPDDQFGVSVAVSGDTVVVGADWEDSNAIGVNGNQSDNSLSRAGAAYVFVWRGASWSQQAYLKASNTGAGDRFGQTVAVSGDTVVVGAPQAGPQNHGAAYVFVRNGTSWSQQAYLSTSSGYSVAVSGDTVVIGLRGSAGPGRGTVFVRSGTSWSQQAVLNASDGEAGDHFGESVAVSADTAVVGARYEDSNATGVNGDEGDNSSPRAGAAYVFVRSGTSWSQQAYLKASNTDGNDLFGRSVGVSGDTVVVGAEFEDSNATGANGDQSDNSASFAGAAYVFVRNGASWSQQAYLKASNTDAGDRFGRSISVSGDIVVAGARFEGSTSTGVNGDQGDNSAGGSGAAYVFVRSGTSWSQQAYLKASNSGGGDWFGRSVATSGDLVVVGALREDSNALGVNGNESDNSATDSGAAYVFCMADADILTYCTGKTTSQGCVPFLDSVGTPSLSDTGPFTVRGNDFAPANGGVLIYGYAKSNLSYHGGKLCIKAPIRTAGKKVATIKGAVVCTAVSSTGRLTTNFKNHIQSKVDPLLTCGQRVFVQWYQRDPVNTIAGFADALSDGMRFTIVP